MMHGLVLRTLQDFVIDTYGHANWGQIATHALLDPPDFEAMWHYDEALLPTLMGAVEAVLGKPRETCLEDVGTYLVSHPNSEGLRRLLRFGGVDFIEFLHSLDDLPDRTRLAVSDLILPDIELNDQSQTDFQLRVTNAWPGFVNVLTGVLRAMADDYGALILLEDGARYGNVETLTIAVIETCYAEGRDFDLSKSQTDRRVAS